MAEIQHLNTVFVSELSLGKSWNEKGKKKLAEVSTLMYGLNIVCVERSGVRRSAQGWWLASVDRVPSLNSLLFGCSR